MKQRNWLDNDIEKLKKEYLQIPSHYSEMIDRCVQSELLRNEGNISRITKENKK